MSLSSGKGVRVRVRGDNKRTSSLFDYISGVRSAKNIQIGLLESYD